MFIIPLFVVLWIAAGLLIGHVVIHSIERSNSHELSPATANELQSIPHLKTVVAMIYAAFAVAGPFAIIAGLFFIPATMRGVQKKKYGSVIPKGDA